MNQLKRIATALVLVPLVLLIVFKAPLWGVALFVALIAVLAAIEYAHIVKHYGLDPMRGMLIGFTVVLIGTAYAAVALGTLKWPILLLSVAPFILLTSTMRRDLRDSLPSSAVALFGSMYLGLSLATLIWMRSLPDGVFWIVILFAVVWIGDTVAMYVGKSIGRHKLAPRVSPKKTWEGAVGSVVGSVAAALIIAHFYANIVSASAYSKLIDSDAQGTFFLHRQFTMLAITVIAIILNIAGQLGDLIESVLKRGADVKDSGSLLPGHGGILDRIDALLFAAPVLWCYLAITRA